MTRLEKETTNLSNCGIDYVPHEHEAAGTVYSAPLRNRAVLSLVGLETRAETRTVSSDKMIKERM